MMDLAKDKSYILGLNLPLKSRCHESGAALIDLEGKILFAVNEERLSRKKQDGDFPEKSIQILLEQTGITREQVRYVAVPTLTRWQKITRFAQFFFRERLTWIGRATFWRSIFRMVRAEVAGPRVTAKKKGETSNQEQEAFVMRYFWRDFIRTNFPRAEIVEVDHHIAHAAGAYFTSPWENSLIVTCDGAGNLLSSLVGVGERGDIKVLDKTFVPHSVGTFWGSITKVCGFRSGTRHGGKTTGLAAQGNPDKLIGRMRQAIWCEGLQFRAREDLFFERSQLVPNWANYNPERMKEFLGPASREDVAAAAQQRLMEVITELVKNARQKVEYDKIVLAGGVFANVLVNQKILELPGISDVYVFPAMSDGGLALGAALYTLSRLKKRAGGRLMPRALEGVYLGPAYERGNIEAYLKNVGAKYSRMEHAPRDLARLVHSKKIVAFYQGRMEYGPRALGNRSILYSPTDPKVNDWLNERLNRSEFMPFAPVTLLERIKDCYEDISGYPLAAKYMTITYQCTDKMKHEAPACVHIDGTARPQVIRREDNAYYYDVVSEYYKLSGIPTLINTSFNMHEEPIVCTPRDALRAFLDAKLDFLAMEDFLLSYEENKHLTHTA